MMFAARSAQYWLWFLLFGVISALVDYSSSQSFGAISGESLWLLLGGLIGILMGAFRALTRPYDLLIGLVFVAARRDWHPAQLWHRARGA
jgi:uncharacterized protein YqgC (DUF456 family)